MAQDFDNNTLKISSKFLEDMSCYGTSSKIILNCPNTLELSVTPNLLVIHNTFSLKQTNKSRNLKTLLDTIQSHNALRIMPPIKIESLFNNELLLTLRVDGKWYEFICSNITFDIHIPYNSKTGFHDYNSRFVEVKIFFTRYSTNIINTITLEKLNLRTETIAKYNYNRRDYDNKDYVRIPAKYLYSVETKGNYHYPSMNSFPNSPFHVEKWRPDSILFSRLILTVNFEQKIIQGKYYNTEKSGSGRRTSNGWESCYSTREAVYYHSFEFIYQLEDYLEVLPEKILPLEGSITEPFFQSDNITTKQIIIDFCNPKTFHEINKVLNFNVSGYSYSEYE